MKLAKRLVSVALALLMAFSCFSLLASAADSNDIKLEFKFYREVSETVVGEDGQTTTTTKWIPTTKVARGETIKARLFVDTSYTASSSALFWMYPENFLTLDTSTLTEDSAAGNYKMPLNTTAGSAVVDGAWDIRVVYGTDGAQGKAHDLTCDGSCMGDSFEPYVPLSEFDGYDWLYNSISGDTAQNLSSGTEGVDKYGDKYWLYELTFTVNKNATANDKGYIKMHEGSIMSMPDYEYSIGHIAKSPDGDGAPFTDNLVFPYSEDFNWDLSALTAEKNLLTVDQTVRFVDGANGSVANDSFYGYIGDAVTVPAVTADAGYVLAGWELGTVVRDEETGEIVYDEETGEVVGDFTSAKTFRLTETAPEGDTTSAYIGDFTVPYEETVLRPVYETTTAPTSTYTVNTYVMDEDGKWSDDPTSTDSTKTGNVGSDAKYIFDAAANEGLYVDTAKSTPDLKTTVTEDDNDVINVYLARKAQTVKYVDENGDAIDSLGGTYYYGKTYDIAAKVDKVGYDWAGWVVNDAVYGEATATAKPATDGEEVIYKASYTPADNKVIINAVYDDVEAGTEATKPFEISAAKGYEIKTGYKVKIVDELPKEGEEEANVTYVLKSALNVEHYHLVDGQTLEIAVADDGNAVLNLNYDVNEYTVKFLDEDGTTEIESFTEAYLTEIEVPEATDKTAVGKNFVEWVGGDEPLQPYDPIIVKGDATYTAKYESEEVYVTYIADGEAPEGFTEPKEKAYNYGDTFTLEPVAPATGYTFSGWTVEGHASYDAETGVYTVGTEPIEITGTWTHNLYTVTFYLDEGMTKKFGEKQYHYGETIVADTPDQDDILGYKFDGWAYEDEDGKVMTTAEMPAKDVIATAMLTAYTVTFYDVYDTPVDTLFEIANVTTDDLPDMAENEADNNYDFVEWRVGSVDGAKATYPMPVTSDIDLYAYGTVDFIYYKDRDDNGEPIDEHKKYTFAFGHEVTESDIADLTEPTKTGYAFNGWDNDPVGFPAEGHNLAVAGWKVKSFTATFNAVNGDIAGAFADSEVTKTVENVEFGTEINFTDVPEATGYTFAYWSEDGVTEAELVMDKEDKTYTAVYTPNGEAKYTVEIYLMDAEGNYPTAADKTDTSKSATIGTKVSAAHADYTDIIDSYYSADTSEKADNVTSETLAATGTTLKLYYARAKYAVTVDGEPADEVYHGGTFEAPAAPIAEAGKEFAGWIVGDKIYNVGDAIEVTGATALTAKWNDLKYTVTFKDAEGREISKIENVAYNATLTAEQIAAAEDALPSLEGKGLKYTGWDADTAAAITADTVIAATTAKETYTIKFVTGVDGLTVADLPVTFGDDITAKVESLATEGLNFKTWVTDLDTKEAASMAIADLGDDGAVVTYYAYWTANITFVDGDATETKELDKGANISANAPTFAGMGADYEAGVWYTGADGKGDALAADAVVTANATYYAYYAPKNNIAYSVEIYEEKLEADKAEGESEYALVKTIAITDATAGASALYNADREGFIFKNNEPAAPVVASDLVVKAYYDRVDDITITVDNESKDYEYGDKLNPEVPPTTEGQEFDKWVDKDGNEVKVPTTITEDMDGLEITATYKYVITFIGFDGQTVNDDAQAQDSLIVAPAAPGVADYTFRGWYTATNGAGTKLDPAADKVTGVATYYAYYTANENISYTVEIYEEKLEADKVAGESEYALAATITVEDAKAGESALYNEARTGFTYEKNEPAAPVVASGLVVKAYYTRNLVNVTVNGEDKEIEYGTEISEPTPTPPAGQEFDKWVDENNNEITKWPVIAEEGTEIKPVYKNSNIMITFKDGDKVVSEGEQTFGDELTLYAYAPVGYTFEGWYTDAGLTNKVEDGALVPATATTYYAKTTVQSFSLSFVVDNATVEGYPTTVDYGTAIVAPAHPDKTAEGLIFAGWFDADGEKLVATMPAKDVVYTARYTLDTEPVNYTIEIYHMALDGKTYELSGSSVGTATIGTEQKVTPGDVKGFTFDEAKSNTKDTVTADGKMVLSIYYARNLYTASFDGAEHQVFFGAVLPTVDAPEAAEGKAFAGWVETTSGKKNTEYSAMPDSDLVFESTWTDATYTITYVVDGEVKEPVEYVYGAKVDTPETPTATGMKFAGWSPEVPETMPAKNLIIVAKFEPNVYTVTFTVDGEVFDKKVVEYDDEIVLPTSEPTKDNFEFTGWAGYTDGMKMPAENLTFEASFDRVKVMLIPKNDTCTTVIDRAGGTVDDYVAGESVWYVYGLRENLKETQLRSDYIDVQGDGRIEIEYRKKDDGSTYAPRTGTGTVINVYDNVTGELVESFYIIIFGDVNGDSYIQSADAAVVNDEALMAGGLENLWSIEGLAGYKPYMFKAANLDGDKIISSTDTALIKNSALGISTIDQTAAAVTDL